MLKKMRMKSKGKNRAAPANDTTASDNNPSNINTKTATPTNGRPVSANSKPAPAKHKLSQSANGKLLATTNTHSARRDNSHGKKMKEPPPIAPPSDSGSCVKQELVHLRTPAEIQAARETVEAYSVPIMARTSDETIIALKPFVPQMELQHLRRLARPHYLPQAVIAQFPKPTFRSELSLLYLLVGPVSCGPIEQLESILSETTSFKPNEENGENGRKPQISILSVPKHVPTSTQQADKWSSKYWPTVYKRGNPFGPHPTLIEGMLEKLERVGEYMALARQAAKEVSKAGLGCPSGGVIVNPKNGHVITVAGDGRLRPGDERRWANPLDHTVMRLVTMVAQKRLDDGIEVSPDSKVKAITATEEKYFPGDDASLPDGSRRSIDRDSEPVDGDYLCHKLLVFLTHEPCTMCAMALLHSRIGCCVFEHAMVETGAFQPEKTKKGQGLGYGIFWRSDLNWKYHCFQWFDPNGTAPPELRKDVCA